MRNAFRRMMAEMPEAWVRACTRSWPRLDSPAAAPCARALHPSCASPKDSQLPVSQLLGETAIWVRLGGALRTWIRR